MSVDAARAEPVADAARRAARARTRPTSRRRRLDAVEPRARRSRAASSIEMRGDAGRVRDLDEPVRVRRVRASRRRAAARPRRAAPSPPTAGSRSRSRCLPSPALRCCGKRRRSTATISRVSSTESVVCVMYASGASVGQLERLRVGDRLDEHDRVGRLAGRALDLLVSGVADQHDRVAAPRVAPRLRVHLRHERARRVDRRRGRARPPPSRTAGATPCAEKTTVAPSGTSSTRVDEDRAALLELAHDVRVVDDLLADVDGLPVERERPLDRLDRPLDAGAIAARRGQEDPLHQTAADR